MNKKFIALAVAAAVAAPAALAADNEVVLYGQVNLGLNITTQGTDQLKVSNISSRIGFKGQEDLGGGVKAFFKVETGILPDTGTAPLNSDDKAMGFGSREAWVGLKGDFGSVGLGRGKTPYTLATEELDPFYFDESLGLTQTSKSQYRANNSIRYDGEFGPISVAVNNSFGEDKNAGGVNKNASNEISASLKFSGQGFSVFGAVNSNKPGGEKARDAYLLGASANIGDLNLGGAVQHTDNDIGKNDDVLLLVGYAMGNASVQLGGIIFDEDRNTKDQVTAGFYYSLSKRTTVLTEYTSNYGGEKSNNSFIVGLAHSF